MIRRYFRLMSRVIDSPQNENPLKVLLVDDSRFLRVAGERTLAKAGYNVNIAVDGEEALKLVAQTRYDLVILDMLLPKLSGVEVLRQLRGTPATASIPVVVLSSLPESNREKLLNEGAAEYCEKSLLTSERGQHAFLEVVQRVLARARKHAQGASG
jgi:CheY-like chemotaxis protein